MNKYDADYFGWTQEQSALMANLIDSGNSSPLDLNNLLKELESASWRVQKTIEISLTFFLTSLLKWKFLPKFQHEIMAVKIRSEREYVSDIVGKNAGIKSKLDEVIQNAYGMASISAASETGLPLESFPDTCPWHFEQFMTTDFLPA